MIWVSILALVISVDSKAQETQKEARFLKIVSDLLSNKNGNFSVHVAVLKTRRTSELTGDRYGDLVIEKENIVVDQRFFTIAGEHFEDSIRLQKLSDIVHSCSFLPRYFLTTTKPNADFIVFDPVCMQMAVTSNKFRDIHDMVYLTAAGSARIEHLFNQILMDQANSCQLKVGSLQVYSSKAIHSVRERVLNQGLGVECLQRNSFIVEHIPPTTERHYQQLFKSWPEVDSVKASGRGLASSNMTLIILLSESHDTEILKEKCKKFCEMYFRGNKVVPQKTGPFFEFLEISDMRNLIFQQKNYYERLDLAFYLGLQDTKSMIVITGSILVAGGTAAPPRSAYTNPDYSLHEDASSFLSTFQSSLDTYLKKR